MFHRVTVPLEEQVRPGFWVCLPVRRPPVVLSPQGHPQGNLHQLMSANIQIIRSGAPVQIGTSAAPPQTFGSHLPRGRRGLMTTSHHTAH